MWHQTAKALRNRDDFIKSLTYESATNGCPVFTSPNRILIVGTNARDVRQELLKLDREIQQINMAIAGEE